MSLAKLFSVLVLSLLLVPAVAAQTIARGQLTGPDDARAWSEAVKQMRTVRLSVAWTDVTLADAIKELRNHLGRNILFAAAAEEKKSTTISLELADVTVGAVARLLQTSAKIRFLFEGGFIFVTTPEDAAQRSLEIRVYDVADLLYQPPDFPGPPMHIHPGKPERAPDETPASARDGGEMTDLLRTLVGSEPWDVPGTSITISKHKLIVRQTPEVHAKIRQMLAALTVFL